MGVDAEFTGLGRFESPNSPQFGTSGVDRVYDDGFNLVDVSGNAGGLTTNWGFQDASQFDAQAGTISLSTFESLSNGSVETSDGAHLSVQATAFYDVGELDGWSLSSENPARWGVRFDLGYQRIEIGDNSTLTTDLVQNTDTFALNGVIPPTAPFSGSFGDPGPLLSDLGGFSQQISTGGGVVNGNREIEANLFLLSLGPYVELPVTKKLSVTAQVGGTLGIIGGEFSFTSETSLPGGASQSAAGKESETEVLGGFYVGAGLNYALNENWSLSADARYQYLNSFEIEANGSGAELDFGSFFLFNFGATYRF